MNICPNCNSECEDNFDLCWNCQYSFSENKIILNADIPVICPHCNTEVEASFVFCPNCQHKLGLDYFPTDPAAFEGDLKIDCLRCKVPMFFKGKFRFHAGTTLGPIDKPFELFINREPFDLYFCPKCGKIEFFLPQGRKSEL